MRKDSPRVLTVVNTVKVDTVNKGLHRLGRCCRQLNGTGKQSGKARGTVRTGEDRNRCGPERTADSIGNCPAGEDRSGLRSGCSSTVASLGIVRFPDVLDAECPADTS
jgi:hypothetical protein